MNNRKLEEGKIFPVFVLKSETIISLYSYYNILIYNKNK